MDALYHYCSTNSFYSIIKSRAIQLSALTLSNDSMEGKLIPFVISEIAKKNGLDDTLISDLKIRISFLEETLDGLGFCLSEEKDLLSQWRGYADDAMGFSIGFSKKYLDRLSELSYEDKKEGFLLHKVEYSKEKQEALIEPIFNEIKKCIDKGIFKKPSLGSFLILRSEEEREKEKQNLLEVNKDFFLRATVPLASKLFVLKNAAFSEEKEWRLISLIVKNSSENSLFRPIIDKIIPYREYSFFLDQEPIAEIILGPKNKTPLPVVDSLLKLYGFNNVKVSLSAASYR